MTDDIHVVVEPVIQPVVVEPSGVTEVVVTQDLASIVVAPETTQVTVEEIPEIHIVVGIQGAQGVQGIPGVGIPIGGIAEQLLAKVNGTDYNTYWKTVDLSSYLTQASADLRYLKLDQTTPQITVGTFKFPQLEITGNEIYLSSVLPVYLAGKNYVGNKVNILFIFLFSRLNFSPTISSAAKAPFNKIARFSIFSHFH